MSSFKCRKEDCNKHFANANNRLYLKVLDDDLAIDNNEYLHLIEQ